MIDSEPRFCVSSKNREDTLSIKYGNIVRHGPSNPRFESAFFQTQVQRSTALSIGGSTTSNNYYNVINGIVAFHHHHQSRILIERLGNLQAALLEIHLYFSLFLVALMMVAFATVKTPSLLPLGSLPPTVSW